MENLYSKVQRLDNNDNNRPPLVKMIKLMEEIGELSEVLLIEDGYKYNDKGKLPEIEEHKLEEGVDVLIQSMCILNSMGFSYIEIEEMFHKKCAKWQGNVESKKNKI